jgi:penicillin-binding protein 2B
MIKKIRARSLLIGGVFTLFFVALLMKVYWIQVVEASWLVGQAEQNWETDKILAPVRGSITDRNDKVLAQDATAYTVAVNPEIIDSYHIVDDVARGLADILKDGSASGAELEAKIREKATKKKDNGDFSVHVEIRNEGWKVDKEKADKVQALIEQLKTKLNTKRNIGIYLVEEKKRYYPGETLAAHILGYTNKEGQPAMGLEATLDDVLKGVPGMLSYEKDAKGVELPGSKVSFKPAEDGKTVRLTIDKNIQYYIESTLKKIDEKFHPKSMTAIAVDPQTMEILGMANVPTFNPNSYWNIGSQRDFINHAVASQYEPGSTFKLVTLAGAVQEGLFNPNEMYQSGSIQVPGARLHDHNNVGWGQISFLDGLKRSSNVAFVKLGYEKLGEQKLKSYIDAFGFGAKTGIDIQGEVSGNISMRYPSEFATATYGQGRVVVTAIQQTAAYAAIANGGKLMWPHVIKDIIDPKTGDVIKSFEPRVIKQVVPESTAKKVTEYLEQVVSDQQIGTGKNAYIEGYRVAGKTGTANKVVDGEKGYSTNKWVISFIGYAPADNPRILVTVIADEPDLGGDYHRGGEVAPPAFREIVSQSLQYMGIPSNANPAKTVEKASESPLQVPDLTNLTLEESKDAVKQVALGIESLGKGARVVDQFPKPGTEIGPTQRIYIAMQPPEQITVPSLTGKSLRDALEVCSFLHAKCQITGEGYVSEQSVSGEGSDRIVSLVLQPKPQAEVQSQPTADQQLKSDAQSKQKP